jgi:hypothetical protein
MTHRSTSTLVRLAPLVALVVGALIPYGWIAQHWAWFGAFVNTLFATEAAHSVGHTLIFAAIGITFLRIAPWLIARPWPYFGLILVVALAQEGLQLITKGRGVVLNDITDICIDLVAAAVVIAIARFASERGTRRAPVVQ